MHRITALPGPCWTRCAQPRVDPLEGVEEGAEPPAPAKDPQGEKGGEQPPGAAPPQTELGVFATWRRRLSDPKWWAEVTVDPSATPYYRWLQVVSLAVLYNLLLIIARQCFWLLQQDYTALWLTLDYCSDLVYLLDIGVHCRTEYLEHGLQVRDVRLLRAHYVRRTQFKLDLLALLPTDLLYLHLGTSFPLVRLNRLLKVGLLLQCFERAEANSSYPNTFRIANLLTYILILIHWNACFYFQLSAWIGFGHDTLIYPSIDDPDGTNPNATLARMYMLSFFWSTLTMTVIADLPPPIVDAEYVFLIANFLVGVFAFATIVGKVGSMLTSMNAQRAEFQARVDAVKRYMRFRRVDRALERRVLKWFDYLWNNSQSLDGEASLAALPSKLKAEVAISVHMEALRRVAIFKECEEGLLTELVMKLKLAVFSPGDFVCRKGDIGKELYIIKCGRLTVVGGADNATVFATLQEGTVFGEISVLNIAGNKNGNRRTANIRSVGYSDLFVLSKEDLWASLAEYPEARRTLIEKGRTLLRKDNLLDEEGARRQDLDLTSVEDKVDQLESTHEIVRMRLVALKDDFELMQRQLLHRLATVQGRMRACGLD